MRKRGKLLTDFGCALCLGILICIGAIVIGISLSVNVVEKDLDMKNTNIINHA